MAEGVLTGAGCAGKTSAEKAIRRWSRGRDFRLIFMPETASLVINAAAPDIAELYTNDKMVHDAVERVMYKVHGNQRQAARELASSFREDCLLIFDRAEMDVSTYMTQLQFRRILNDLNTTVEQVRNSYDFVIHMETSAKRVPQFYGYDNPARWETPEQAIESDDRTLAAWTGHPNLHVVEGRVDFEDKVREVISVLEDFVP